MKMFQQTKSLATLSSKPVFLKQRHEQNPFAEHVFLSALDFWDETEEIRNRFKAMTFFLAFASLLGQYSKQRAKDVDSLWKGTRTMKG